MLDLSGKVGEGAGFASQCAYLIRGCLGAAFDPSMQKASAPAPASASALPRPMPLPTPVASAAATGCPRR
jgi:hypothetical protein